MNKRSAFNRNHGVLLSAFLLAAPCLALAQGYDATRPWGQVPQRAAPAANHTQGMRYNPWAEMREVEHLPPPEYRGEADENAPKYHEPNPTYRELPQPRQPLQDPRAYASPWSAQTQYWTPDYGRGNSPYMPYAWGGGAGMPWGAPYGMPGIGSPYGFLQPWGGFVGPWPR